MLNHQNKEVTRSGSRVCPTFIRLCANAQYNEQILYKERAAMGKSPGFAPFIAVYPAGLTCATAH